MAGVTLQDVSCIFRNRRGNVRAVANLDLRVADGEYMVLVGPSGCGKTTTLRLIAGLLEPTSGAIRIGERVVNQVPPRDRHIGMVFQNYALYPHMTVRKNLAFGLTMRGVAAGEIRRRVDETAAKLSIGDLLERRPAGLSGGEKQRVALGRAIVGQPNVFLFDEPLSNLDPSLRMAMRAELKALHSQLQTTVIHVTHDQEEAMTLGERIAVMKAGVLQQVGGPLEIYEKPANLFVAAFLGTPPMNFFRGELAGSGAETWFSGAVGRVALRQCVAERDGPVALGIRPHHVRIVTDLAEVKHAIKAAVRFIEPLGDCANVHLIAPGGEPIVARVTKATEHPTGQNVAVIFEPQHVHLFGADDPGRRLEG